MSGYPDSHLGGSDGRGISRRTRRLLLILPLVAVAAWFLYLWSVSGVLTSVEKYPGTDQVRAEGYLKRSGLGSYARHGHWVFYHKNGEKLAEGTYTLGEKQNDWQYWSPDGRPISAAEAAPLIGAAAHCHP